MPIPRQPPIPAAIALPHLTQTHTVPGRLKITELFFNVPLDWSNPLSQKIRIFCRAAERLETPASGSSSTEPKPWLVYIPGGPGFGASPPQDMGVTGMIVDRGYRFLCFDHRGMGLSTTVTADSVLAQGDVKAQVTYLKHFRADNAVRDLEAIRRVLTSGQPTEKRKWSIWGQSYGGFVALTYLSYYPQGLREVFSTGGLAPITQKSPDEVYRRLFIKLAERNQKYYAKYPEDRQRMRAVMSYLHHMKTEDGEDDAIRMPAGGILTPDRFRSIGISFGAHGGLDDVHNTVLRAANDLEVFGYLSTPTLSKIESWDAFDNQCIYAVLHEPLYCQGTAPNWSADRMLYEARNAAFHQDETVFFFGEMVFPHDLKTYPELQRLAPAAEALAQAADWPNLYDIEQLKQNDVPVYAAIYVDDMYVDFGFAKETSCIVRNCKTYITNILYHDAVRSRTDEIARALFALRDDNTD
jgi:pimeloyl-ACP methyl ester carboxylesterase